MAHHCLLLTSLTHCWLTPLHHTRCTRLNYTRHRLYGDKAECGACNECGGEHVQKRPNQRDMHVTVHCYEASPANYATLKKVQELLVPEEGLRPAKGNSLAKWHVHHKAATEQLGAPLKFEKGCDTELCSRVEGKQLRDKAGDESLVDVPETTVDHEMFLTGVNYIDFLKIDTEGYDWAVLKGADGALAQHRIGMLLFEYHGIGLWQTLSLRTVLKYLEGYGYECYYDGQPTLTRLSGCWHSSYELKWWSNVVCVHESHFMAPVMHSMSFVGSSSY
jgi:FkbM family methyltransferase